MRYAEVEHARSGLRLLRLGSCDFDFDAEAATLEGDARKLETIAEAIGDVFSGSRSSDFSVVMSPGSVISFFSPVPDRLPEEAKRKQLEADTVLIGGTESALNVVAEPVMPDGDEGGESVTWYHVAAVPARVRRNVGVCLATFEGSRHHVVTSMQAGSRVAAALERPRLERTEKKAAAVIGCHSVSTEVAVLDDARWRFGSHTASTMPSDIAYALLSTVEQARVEPNSLGRVYVFGDTPDEAMLTALRNASPAEITMLDPLAVVENEPAAARSSFEPVHYVLCVGASL